MCDVIIVIYEAESATYAISFSTTSTIFSLHNEKSANKNSPKEYRAPSK